MNDLKFWIVIGILGIQSYYDIRYKKVPLFLTVIGTILGLIYFLGNKDIHLFLLGAFIPGAVCLLYGKVTKEALGYGDGLLILMMGCYFNLKELLGICFLAFMIGGLVALGLLVIFRRSGKQEIPFVPFLFVAVILRGMMYVLE